MTVAVFYPDVIADHRQEIATRIMRHTKSSGNIIQPTAIEQLDFTRSDTVFTATHSVYEPILAIVVQGQKKAFLGEEIYQYGAMQYLVVSVNLNLARFS
jgi:AraC-type transcriptional regulator N-terminus